MVDDNTANSNAREEEDSRSYIVRLIEDNPDIFKSNDTPPSSSIKTDEFGEEYVEPLVEGSRCRYFYPTSYLVRLLVVFSVFSVLLALNLFNLSANITATKIVGLLLVLAIFLSTGGRLFGLSFNGKPVPGIPVLSDIRFNLEPALDEIRRENAAKKKAEERHRAEPRRRGFGGLLGGAGRKDRKKVNIGFKRKEYYGVVSPGTYLGDNLERLGLNISAASAESGDILSPGDIAKLIDDESEFDKNTVLAVSSITGISVKDWNTVVSDWDSVKEDWERLSDD